MNRCEALQAGAAILTAAGIDGEIATVSPRNPQAFVITTPGVTSGETRERIREEWKKIFAETPLRDIPLLIMQNGMTLSVIDAVEAEKA